jgi:hypothetical protein
MDDKGSIEVLKENLHAENLSMNRLVNDYSARYLKNNETC